MWAGSKADAGRVQPAGRTRRDHQFEVVVTVVFVLTVAGAALWTTRRLVTTRLRCAVLATTFAGAGVTVSVVTVVLVGAGGAAMITGAGGGALRAALASASAAAARALASAADRAASAAAASDACLSSR